MVPTAALIPNLTKRLSWVLSKRKGVAVALVGPPGVGKTWTARQVLAGVPCPTRQLPASLAAGGLLAALPMAPDSPPWVRSALERFARGQATPLAAAGALAAHLVQLAPFILLVEDLHEAEGERLAFWVALAEAVGHSRGVALLVTGRNALPAPFENHAVEPLSPEASALLLEGEAGSALPPEATDWIWRHAQGNPLFTLEYFRHLGRLGYLWSDGQRWRWRPPPDDLRPISVEAVIAQQLQALGSAPEAQALLTAKALLPPSSPAGRLARVSGLSPEALAAWEGAARGRRGPAGRAVRPPALPRGGLRPGAPCRAGAAGAGRARGA
ncbi:ATP-binding protein [Calidithermus chliarophilus]|uniref:ATP-binding protein n=1 Tax=Calidithermus chliarophilus TaxID=52023 RepID=UPI0003FB0FBC|nr:ATP-binding protein [Calidithermus chliarophilus]